MKRKKVEALRGICILQGFEPIVERSRSGKGAHVWLLFSEPIDAKIARHFGYGLLNVGLDFVTLRNLITLIACYRCKIKAISWAI